MVKAMLVKCTAWTIYRLYSILYRKRVLGDILILYTKWLISITIVSTHLSHYINYAVQKSLQYSINKFLSCIIIHGRKTELDFVTLNAFHLQLIIHYS